MKKNIAEDKWTFPEILKEQYNRISPRAIQALESVVQPWSRRKGQSIVDQDEHCPHWIFVSYGLHRVMFTKNGKSDTLFFDGGGAVFTSFHYQVKKEKSVFRLEALMDCAGWTIKNDVWEELSNVFTDLVRFENALYRHQYYFLEEYYRRNTMSTPWERYECFFEKWPQILQLPTRSFTALTKYIPQKIIAEYLSISPQMLSRLRRREMEALRDHKKQ